MRKKVALTVAAVAMVGTLAVGGTLAWFTDTETATNVVTFGSVDVTLDEEGGTPGATAEDGLGFDNVVPGVSYDKEVTIKNVGNNPAYVRAIITIDGEAAAVMGDNSEDNNIKFNGLGVTATEDRWTSNDDGSYSLFVYYKDKLAAADSDVYEVGAEEWTLFTDIEIPDSWNNDEMGKTFNIKVDVEAIQAEGFADATEAWQAVEGLRNDEGEIANGTYAGDTEGTARQATR